MKIPVRNQAGGLKFNITPLIDIVFLLIIFFLAASHFARSETEAPIDLPTAQPDQEQKPDIPKRLIVTVTKADQYLIGMKPVDLLSIEQRIIQGVAEHGKRFEVRLRGDRSVEFRLIEPLLVACARHGVNEINFAVVAG